VTDTYQPQLATEHHSELKTLLSTLSYVGQCFFSSSFQFTVIALVQPVEARNLTISHHGKEFCFNSGTSYSSRKEP